MRTDADPVLQADGLRKSFGGRRVLTDVGLVLRRGEIQGIIGPNGSGKSTLINIVSGALRADSGSIRLAGGELGRASRRRRSLSGIGRTFQVPEVFETLSLRQHILLGAREAGPGWGFEAAAILGLDQHLDRPVGLFSHGLRRMAEICHVVAARPLVFFLDEPAAGLSAVEVLQLDEVLRWLSARMAVCIVEHNMKFLLNVEEGQRRAAVASLQQLGRERRRAR